MAGLSKKYLSGRARGYEIANICMVNYGGVDALREEIKFRDDTGILTDACVYDLDKACKQIKELSAETHGLMYLYVMHDEFDHGPKRTQRTLDKWNQESKKLVDGGITIWSDFIRNIEQNEKISIEFNMDIRKTKLDDYEQGRERALRQYLEAVEQGNDPKNITAYKSKQKARMSYLNKEVDDACWKIKQMSMQTFIYLSTLINKKLYGFGEERMKRFIDRHDKKTDCLGSGYCTWEDIIDTMRAETGISENFEGIRNEVWSYGGTEVQHDI